MKIKYIIFLVFLLMSVSSCQDVKDGLTGSKKSNSDEFLIQKKNPLVLPPDYSMLPEPKNTINTNNQIVEEDQEIEELLGTLPDTSQGSDIALEEMILKKINETSN